MTSNPGTRRNKHWFPLNQYGKTAAFCKWCGDTKKSVAECIEAEPALRQERINRQVAVWNKRKDQRTARDRG